MGKIHATLETRIATKFAVDDTTECWMWTASTDNHGYGQIYDNAVRKPRKAYRVMYELHVGPVAEGMQLDHLCRNRRCVNPAHLEPVTQSENIRRGNARSIVVQRTGRCVNGHPAEGNRVKSERYTRCRACRREQYRRDRDANNV